MLKLTERIKWHVEMAARQTEYVLTNFYNDDVLGRLETLTSFAGALSGQPAYDNPNPGAPVGYRWSADAADQYPMAQITRAAASFQHKFSIDFEKRALLADWNTKIAAIKTGYFRRASAEIQG